MNENFIFGDLLRELRKDKGWTQKELGKKVSVGKSTIGSYETGRIQPSRSLVLQFAELFDVSVDYLYGVVRSQMSAKDYLPLKLESGEIDPAIVIKKLRSLSIHDRSIAVRFIDNLCQGEKEINT